jgi:hypothetical protein
MQSIYRIMSQISIPEEDLKIPKGQIDSTSLSSVFEIAFAALGSIAFIIIVVSGMKFVLSRGNPDAVAKARNTIIYAAIGLVISMLSFAIVRFVVRGL